MNNSISSTSATELTPFQWIRTLEYWVPALLELFHHLDCDVIPFLYWLRTTFLHFLVTATLLMVDCLWLEKVLHTHAENNINMSKRPQPQIPAKEARASFPFLLIHTKHIRAVPSASRRRAVPTAGRRRAVPTAGENPKRAIKANKHVSNNRGG